MPAKSPKKTIQANPLDNIAPKKDSRISSLPRVKKSTIQGRKKMSANNNVQDDTQANVASAEEILANESNAINDQATEGLENAGIDYRHQLAKTKIMNASQWATLAGFIPVIGVDTLTISGVQLKMVYDLCETYQVPFKKEAVFAVIGAAFGGSFTTVIAAKVTDSAVNKIPLIGPIVSFVSQPAISFATTYAIGMLFINHFEKNGTLGDFDLNSTKTIFDEQFQKAKILYKQQIGNISTLYRSGLSKAKNLMTKSPSSDSIDEAPTPAPAPAV